jgi:ferritin-like metal-binding protein YciE
LIAAAQSVEHYEITRYGTLKSWAEQLGHRDAIRLIDETLAEEKNTDQTLTQLAESSANRQAEAA